MTDLFGDALPVFARVPVEPDYFADSERLPIEDMVRDFSRFGQPSVEVSEGAINYLINEFWTSGQRQGHSLHEISYRACFKPQLPEFFIQRLTCPDDAVFDPFMGRGTTPVQAALMGVDLWAMTSTR